MPQPERLEVGQDAAGERLDRFLVRKLSTLSRTRVASLVRSGHVRVGGAAAKPSHRLAAGECVEVELAPQEPGLARAVPEAIPLDILYEDEDLVVVNKPAGMIVHAGAGPAMRGGTLTNALLHRYGALSTAGGAERPGIVHRLDKDTSGALVVARNDFSHRRLAEQFAARTVEKTYLALVHGKLRAASGSIRLAVARDLHRRTRMTARRAGPTGRAAHTDWRALAVLDGFTLVEVALRTGRTHQIRVHFSALGHPVAGDSLYGAAKHPVAAGRALPPLGRNFLHAARLVLAHPRDARRMQFRAPLPAELASFLAALADAGGVPRAKIDGLLQAYL
jgi:23S rRNA pseudouridine1911/1915/1917 synthase